VPAWADASAEIERLELMQSIDGLAAENARQFVSGVARGGVVSCDQVDANGYRKSVLLDWKTSAIQVEICDSAYEVYLLNSTKVDVRTFNHKPGGAWPDVMMELLPKP